eukprot:comp24131_c0_seq1/m.43830 comp24131_c0_seq1/g.43830  ORF comp24131_c0_seq1/g.43830 comp24131_c0_seq1/m.43830 type:complete len:160 (+) comp24131_c0_seq1:1652-2131(+)
MVLVDRHHSRASSFALRHLKNNQVYVVGLPGSTTPTTQAMDNCNVPSVKKEYRNLYCKFVAANPTLKKFTYAHFIALYSRAFNGKFTKQSIVSVFAKTGFRQENGEVVVDEERAQASLPLKHRAATANLPRPKSLRKSSGGLKMRNLKRGTTRGKQGGA